MKLSIVVAQSTNRVIGKENQLPWHLPKDLQYFKKVTIGKPVIMGRKTFESIGRPLPGRANIVISTNANYQAEGITVVSSVTGAIELAESITYIDGVEEAMIIGGAQIYQQALSIADRLYITEVEAEVDGDALFPRIDYPVYDEIYRESHMSDVKNPYSYSFVVYEKHSHG